MFAFSIPASAHFLIEDVSTGARASFHITPDHDPIAGKESVISFDFSKTGFQVSNYTYELTVKSTKGQAVTVPLEVASNVLMATYTFPSQGFYTIRLTATHKDDGVVSKLQYGQRVSRGVIVEHTQSFGLFEIGAMAGVVLVAVSAIIYSLVKDSNKRKDKKNGTKNHE